MLLFFSSFCSFSSKLIFNRNNCLNRILNHSFSCCYKYWSMMMIIETDVLFSCVQNQSINLIKSINQVFVSFFSNIKYPNNNRIQRQYIIYDNGHSFNVHVNLELISPSFFARFSDSIFVREKKSISDQI